jgi:hypothetical protein
MSYMSHARRGKSKERFTHTKWDYWKYNIGACGRYVHYTADGYCCTGLDHTCTFPLGTPQCSQCLIDVIEHLHNKDPFSDDVRAAFIAHQVDLEEGLSDAG